jgi:tetratricopeptide (TPR) repeat protein
MQNWALFPYSDPPFDFSIDDLRNAWDELHRGDCETLPADPKLLEAWCCFHRGEFEQAVSLADECGVTGHAVANKATGIYATYLEEDEGRQIQCFKSAITRAENAMAERPDDPNAHYFHAFNLGRYSQSISIVKALKQGAGGKVLASLRKTLRLQPDHAEAHTALGMYHAEIIDKVGKLIAKMTYGASEGEAIEHFETALELTPSAPIAHIEYGNGLYLLFGDDRLDEVTDLYVNASEFVPRDAMEQLDVESALAELE